MANRALIAFKVHLDEIIHWLQLTDLSALSHIGLSRIVTLLGEKIMSEIFLPCFLIGERVGSLGANSFL